MQGVEELKSGRANVKIVAPADIWRRCLVHLRRLITIQLKIDFKA
jgi:hypothetical protein